MNKLKLIISGGIANIFEWYDYALFGLLAPIIGQKFFPPDTNNEFLLQAFLVFALGYLIRPLGGIFFGILGDKFGRKLAFSSAVICMSFPTLVMGLLPTYDKIGSLSTVLMIVVRMLQGLSMGGTLTGSVSFIIEHSEKKHRGLLSSITMTGLCLGILLCTIVLYAIKTCLSTEAFLDWGWRIPFLIGIVILFVGIYIRNHTKESPLFEEIMDKGNVVQSPLKTVIKNHWFDMIVSIFINSTGSIIFYLNAIYLTSFLRVNRNFPTIEIDKISSAAYVIMAFITLFSGWLSDTIGRRKVLVLYNVIIIVLFSYGVTEIYESGTLATVAIAQIILAILTAAYIAAEPALQAEFYPTNVRNTALSLSYNVATSIFGGTTPYVAEKLWQNTHSLHASGYYVIAASTLSLIALYFYKDRS